MDNFLLLVINPGSTSTKIAVFENEISLLDKTVRHSSPDLARFPNLFAQLEWRRGIIEELLELEGMKGKDFAAIVGRGGLLRPLESGTYLVDDGMVKDLRAEARGSHASNLGAVLAYDMARGRGINAFTVDPVVVDEMEPVARFSGLPEIERRSLFHALNQKAVARRAAAELGKSYKDANLIVAHLGGGISVGAHSGGRVVDVSNALTGEGPFSPERAGGLPSLSVAELSFMPAMNLKKIKKRLVGQGGLVSYLGTNDVAALESRREQEPEVATLLEALAYQVAKEIGAYATVLKGNIDAVVITGGIAHSSFIANKIRERVQFLAPVKIYPGEDEMLALAEGALRVLRGEEEARHY